MVEFSSVSTTPGSMHVTRTFERVLNSCLRPSLSAVTACLVAQYTLPDGNTVLPATDEMLIMCPGLFLLHVGYDRRRAVQHALEVDVDHPVPLVYLQALKEAQRHQPRVVHQDVNGAPFFKDGRGKSLALGPLRHVKSLVHDAATPLLYHARKVGQLVGSGGPRWPPWRPPLRGQARWQARSRCWRPLRWRPCPLSYGAGGPRAAKNL